MPPRSPESPLRCGRRWFRDRARRFPTSLRFEPSGHPALDLVLGNHASCLDVATSPFDALENVEMVLDVLKGRFFWKGLENFSDFLLRRRHGPRSLLHPSLCHLRRLSSSSNSSRTSSFSNRSSSFSRNSRTFSSGSNSFSRSSRTSSSRWNSISSTSNSNSSDSKSVKSDWNSNLSDAPAYPVKGNAAPSLRTIRSRIQ